MARAESDGDGVPALVEESESDDDGMPPLVPSTPLLYFHNHTVHARFEIQSRGALHHHVFSPAWDRQFLTTNEAGSSNTVNGGVVVLVPSSAEAPQP